jgi:hypothetical protein
MIKNVWLCFLIFTHCLIGVNGMGRYIPPLYRHLNVAQTTNLETTTTIAAQTLVSETTTTLPLISIRKRKITIAEFKKMVRAFFKLEKSKQ